MGIFVFIEVTFDFPRLYPLGTYMRSWNKAFTCHENHAKQTTWINEYQTQESRCELLRQRAIYLQEDVDALQKIPEKDIAPEQVQQLQSLEEELAQVKQQYWSGRQTLGDLLVLWRAGAVFGVVGYMGMIRMSGDNNSSLEAGHQSHERLLIPGFQICLQSTCMHSKI
ncbi:hypothetical protein T310_5549 [Rasamsonia emersonii CBS 393.64]|uniref:Uncharacterized protein n=1 Tax=Rasamsonia emersonii (strain ATCC 16479 / CBS 393.64 / IMI 116815) TaxID=1408163 RepID=A0A0F4YQQ5_RASE3|nr:hypothetical protein T310_5549 [Rasamsonia emersonii CBS 393.64]KKA20430.1 hypothetical protein T310_5549 [Rasamsonia emersonii CBS 393.64]